MVASTPSDFGDLCDGNLKERFMRPPDDGAEFIKDDGLARNSTSVKALSDRYFAT